MYMQSWISKLHAFHIWHGEGEALMYIEEKRFYNWNKYSEHSSF